MGGFTATCLNMLGLNRINSVLIAVYQLADEEGPEEWETGILPLAGDGTKQM